VSPRVISSAQTFITKFILPFVIVAVLAFGLRLAGNGVLPIFFPVSLLLAVSVYWYYIRLKKVAIDSDGLVISNYFREIRVPWRQIVDVSGSRWVNTHQVTVTFDRDIGFGASVIFMPKIRLLWPGQESPIAQELRDLILENRDRQ
jgi:PH (Pleckstrin Homology) domain-containing protein